MKVVTMMLHRDAAMVGVGIGATVLVVGGYAVLRLLVRALSDGPDQEPDPNLWI